MKEVIFLFKYELINVPENTIYTGFGIGQGYILVYGTSEQDCFIKLNKQFNPTSIQYKFTIATLS